MSAPAAIGVVDLVRPSAPLRRSAPAPHVYRVPVKVLGVVQEVAGDALQDIGLIEPPPIHELWRARDRLRARVAELKSQLDAVAAEAAAVEAAIAEREAEADE